MANFHKDMNLNCGLLVVWSFILVVWCDLEEKAGVAGVGGFD